MSVRDYILRFQSSYQRIYRNINDQIKQELQIDLSLDQYSFLQLVGMFDDTTITKIARIYGLNKSTITTAVNGLEKKGMLVRQKCERDGRVYVISLTEKGTTSINRIDEFLESMMIDKLTHFSEVDTKKFIHSMEKLAELTEPKNK